MERQGANGCVDGKERILKLVNWLNRRSERTDRQTAWRDRGLTVVLLEIKGW
jgi:hypothetical protein